MRCRSLGVAVLLTLATQRDALAQTTPAPDGEQILAVVHRLFDGMRHGDSAMIRSTLHSDAMLATAVVRHGEAGIERDTIESWLRAVAAPHDSVWDERLSHEIVHQDGTLAVVWADYRFYVGPRFNHCGVDVLTLAKVREEWKILAIADTRRRQPC
jgi:hypothetical protein